MIIFIFIFIRIKENILINTKNINLLYFLRIIKIKFFLSKLIFTHKKFFKIIHYLLYYIYTLI